MGLQMSVFLEKMLLFRALCGHRAQLNGRPFHSAVGGGEEGSQPERVLQVSFAYPLGFPADPRPNVAAAWERRPRAGPAASETRARPRHFPFLFFRVRAVLRRLRRAGQLESAPAVARRTRPPMPAAGARTRLRQCKWPTFDQPV